MVQITNLLGSVVCTAGQQEPGEQSTPCKTLLESIKFTVYSHLEYFHKGELIKVGNQNNQFSDFHLK